MNLSASNPLISDSVARILSDLRPREDFIIDFILNKTKINGLPFTFKDHEYQELIAREMSKPNFRLIVTKPSQVGVTEVALRSLLAMSMRIRGFSTAYITPTATLAAENMKTRVDPIIRDCPELLSMLNKDVNSSSVKMLGDSIFYAFGASPTATNTVISRPIACLMADEYARCDPGIISALRSRQRHQSNKCSFEFSTPLFEDADMDYELKHNCGVIWRRRHQCQRCGKWFFPDVFENIRIPDYPDPFSELNQRAVEKYDLDLSLAYFECPHCERETSPAVEFTEYVDVAEIRNRPKTAIKISAFDAPNIVSLEDICRDKVAYVDAAEFKQQVCGLPASKSQTALDIKKIMWENEQAGSLNVMGLDFAKFNHAVVGTVKNEKLYIHHFEAIKLQDFDRRIPEIIKKFRVICGVVDFMPLTHLAAKVCNSNYGFFAASYQNTTHTVSDVYRPGIKDDEALGKLRSVKIAMNVHFDYLADDLMEHKITFRDNEERDSINLHIENMRRVKDQRIGMHDSYVWIKAMGAKTADHYFHAIGYCRAAWKLLPTLATMEGGNVAVNPNNLVTTFTPKSEI